MWRRVTVLTTIGASRPMAHACPPIVPMDGRGRRAISKIIKVGCTFSRLFHSMDSHVS